MPQRESASRWVHIDVDEIVHETEMAILVRIADMDDDVWLPKSQISDPEDYAAGDTEVSMSITKYIANEKGIEGVE